MKNKIQKKNETERMRTKKNQLFRIWILFCCANSILECEGSNPTRDEKKKRKEKTKEIKGEEEKASFSVLLPSSSSFSVEVYILNLETI